MLPRDGAVIGGSLCFRVPGATCALATFVAHVFATGQDPSSTIEILCDMEVNLLRDWSLVTGTGSAQVLPALGRDIGDGDFFVGTVVEMIVFFKGT